jgi:hypothetical protein
MAKDPAARFVVGGVHGSLRRYDWNGVHGEENW